MPTNIPCNPCYNGEHRKCVGELIDLKHGIRGKDHCSCLANNHERERTPTKYNQADKKVDKMMEDYRKTITNS